MKAWLQGMVITAVGLIIVSVIFGAFYGEGVLLRHHVVIGIIVGITVIVTVGGLAVSLARRVDDV